MSHRVCRQLADGLTMFGFGKRPVPGDAAKYRHDQPFEGNTLTSDRERFCAISRCFRRRPSWLSGRRPSAG